MAKNLIKKLLIGLAVIGLNQSVQAADTSIGDFAATKANTQLCGHDGGNANGKCYDLGTGIEIDGGTTINVTGGGGTNIYNSDGIITNNDQRDVGIYGFSTTLKFDAKDSSGDTNPNAYILFSNDDPQLTLSSTNSGAESSNFYMYDANAIFQDNRGTPVGIQYQGNYDGTLTDDSLVTKRYVDNHVLTGALSQILFYDTSSGNLTSSNSLYYDNTFGANRFHAEASQGNPLGQVGSFELEASAFNLTVQQTGSNFSGIQGTLDGGLVLISHDYNAVFPGADGAAGQAIVTDGMSNLSFAGPFAPAVAGGNFLAGQTGGIVSNPAGMSSEEVWFGINVGAGGASIIDTTFVGFNVGNGASGADRLVSTGFYSAAGSTNAYDSTFYGYQAGNNAPTANNTIAIGNNAGKDDAIDNSSGGHWSMLLGDNTNTGGFTKGIALGDHAVNTETNQIYLSPDLFKLTIPATHEFAIEQTGGNLALTSTGDVRTNSTGNTFLTSAGNMSLDSGLITVGTGSGNITQKIFNDTTQTEVSQTTYNSIPSSRNYSSQYNSAGTTGRTFEGDISDSLNHTIWALNDVAQVMSESTLYNSADTTTFFSQYKADGSVGHSVIGDVDAAKNGTTESINDVVQTFELSTNYNGNFGSLNFQSLYKADGSVGYTSIGDLNSSKNFTNWLLSDDSRAITSTVTDGTFINTIQTNASQTEIKSDTGTGSSFDVSISPTAFTGTGGLNNVKLDINDATGSISNSYSSTAGGNYQIIDANDSAAGRAPFSISGTGTQPIVNSGDWIVSGYGVRQSIDNTTGNLSEYFNGGGLGGSYTVNEAQSGNPFFSIGIDGFGYPLIKAGDVNSVTPSPSILTIGEQTFNFTDGVNAFGGQTIIQANSGGAGMNITDGSGDNTIIEVGVGTAQFQYQTVGGLNSGFAIQNNIAQILSNDGATNVIWSWPTADGSAGEALTTDGAGNLIWGSAGGTPSLTSTYIGFGDGANLLTGSPNFTWDNNSFIFHANDNIGNLNIVWDATTPQITQEVAGTKFILSGDIQETTFYAPYNNMSNSAIMDMQYTSDGLTGFTELGDINAVINGTKFRLDDIAQTYTFNKLGGSGNVFVTATNAGVLGTIAQSKIPVVCGTPANLAGQTAAVSSISTCTPSGDTTYRVNTYLTVTAISAGTVTLQITYVDETNTSRTDTIVTSTSTGVVNTIFPVVIRAKSGNAVTVKTLFTGVSIAYDVGASLEQMP